MYFPKEIWAHIRSYVTANKLYWIKKYYFCVNDINTHFSPSSNFHGCHCQYINQFVKEYFIVKGGKLTLIYID